MPQSRVRTAWNFVVLWLLGYTATFVPYRTAFIEKEDETSNFLPMFDAFVDFMYTVDLVLNFFMAFEDKDKKLETRMKMIAIHYLQTWFPLDFLACIPFQYLEPADFNTSQTEGGEGRDDSGNLMRLAKIPRLYKLLKIVRLFKLVRLMKYNRSINRILNLYNMGEGVKRLVQVLFWMLFLVHLVGCLFFLVAKFEEFGPSSWVSQSGLVDTVPSKQYLFSVNWALQTLTTVGYGDITAGTLGEKITAIIWMIGGVGFYSYTIGGLASMIADIDKREAQIQQKLQTLSDYVKRTNLPADTEAKIRTFLNNNHQEQLQSIDQKQLFDELPSNLRNQIVEHTQGDIVRQIRFFDKKSQEFIWQMLPLFIQMKVYKEDILYGQNDQAEEVFFIFRGRVKFYYDLFFNNGPAERHFSQPINLTVEGSYFGDIEVLLNQGRDGRMAMAIAMTDCYLLVVTRAEMIKLLKQYPKVKKEMKLVASRRKRRNAKYIDQLHERFDEKFKDEDGEDDDWTPPVQPSYLLQYRAEKRDSMYRSSFGRSNSERFDGQRILERVRLSKK